MTKILEGIYSTQDEAMAAIERLKEHGYNRSDIFVVANTQIHGNLLTNMKVDTTVDSQAIDNLDEDHRSLWEKIKDAFTLDDPYEEGTYSDPKYDSVNVHLNPYREQIYRGSIALLVEEEPRSTTLTDDIKTAAADPFEDTQIYDPTQNNRVIEDLDDTKLYDSHHDHTL